MTAARPRESAPPVEAGGGLLGLVTKLYLESPLTANDDPEFHRAHIAWEYRTGQWVMEGETGVDGEISSLYGWMSWYRCSPETLALLATCDFGELMARGASAAGDLTAGPCLYIATALVTPWAPDGTLMRLAHAVHARNPGPPLTFWHRRDAAGHSRFVSVLNDLPMHIQ